MRYQENTRLQSISSRFIGRLGFKRRGYINRSRLGGMGLCMEEIGRTIGCGMNKSLKETAGFPLRLAREGSRVRIVGLNGGKGFHDRLAGVGLRLGIDVDVIQNSMCGKMLICRDGARFYLGGGMAQKIQVIFTKGGNQ